MVNGCAVRTSSTPPHIKTTGVVNSYAAVNGFRPYESQLGAVEILDGDGRWGEVVSVDLFGLGGLGVGFVGVRLKLLPFETGIDVIGEVKGPENCSDGNAGNADDGPEDDDDDEADE
jgi:hypothetical protein